MRVTIERHLSDSEQVLILADLVNRNTVICDIRDVTRRKFLESLDVMGAISVCGVRRNAMILMYCHDKRSKLELRPYSFQSGANLVTGYRWTGLLADLYVEAYRRLKASDAQRECTEVAG